MDHLIDKLLKAGHRVPAIVVTGDKVKYAEIMVRLGVTMLELAMAGFHGETLGRLTDEATMQALREMEESGIEMHMEPMFGHWPPLVSEN